MASAPACYGYYILPTVYPSDLAAAIQLTVPITLIGRLRHQPSFILPGLIGGLVDGRLRLDLRRDVRVLINAFACP